MMNDCTNFYPPFSEHGKNGRFSPRRPIHPQHVRSLRPYSSMRRDSRAVTLSAIASEAFSSRAPRLALLGQKAGGTILERLFLPSRRRNRRAAASAARPRAAARRPFLPALSIYLRDLADPNAEARSPPSRYARRRHRAFGPGQGALRKEAKKNCDDAGKRVEASVRETYRYLLAPMQDPDPASGPAPIAREDEPLNLAGSS